MIPGIRISALKQKYASDKESDVSLSLDIQAAQVTSIYIVRFLELCVS